MTVQYSKCTFSFKLQSLVEDLVSFFITNIILFLFREGFPLDFGGVAVGIWDHSVTRALLTSGKCQVRMSKRPGAQLAFQFIPEVLSSKEAKL